MLASTSDFAFQVLQSLQARVAVLDQHGVIVFANDAWHGRRTLNGAAETQPPPAAPDLPIGLRVGDNYLDYWQTAQSDVTRAAIIAGIRQVLRGGLPQFATEYPGDVALGEGHSLLHATQLIAGDAAYAVLIQYDAVPWLAPSLPPDLQTDGQQHELESWDRLSTANSTGVTARTFGVVPLREAAPQLFADLATRYGSALDMAVEQRMYKVQHSISTDLRVLAERIGFARSGPRDVIDIHTAALRTKLQHGPKVVEAYFEESRILLLELMGHLASYYRSYAIGPAPGRKTGPPDTPGQPPAGGNG